MVRNILRNGGRAMPNVETDRGRVVSRLEGEGWVCEHGAKHDKFGHANHPHKITVPRHRVLAMKTARSIAKAAGWI